MVFSMTPFDQAPVLIIGAGRTGTYFADWLERQSLPYLQVDMKPLPVHPRRIGQAAVLGIGFDREVVVEYEERLHRFHCQMIIAATGSRGLAVPFPGWTLPGVLLPSAVQQILRYPAPSLGESVVLLTRQPQGPFVDTVKAHAQQTTVLCWDDLEWIEASGGTEVKRFSWREKGQPPSQVQTIDASTVIVDAGWTPAVDLFHASQFETAVDEQGRMHVRLNERLETLSAPGVYVAGKAAGIDAAPEDCNYEPIFAALKGLFHGR